MGRRTLAATLLRGALPGASILCLVLACQPAQAQAECRSGEKQRVEDDLSRAAAFSAARGTSDRETPDLDQARRFLEACSLLALAHGEMAAGAVYLHAGEAAAAAEHFVHACRLAEEGPRRDLEFGCKSALLVLDIELDRYADADRLARELRELADANGLDTRALASNLVLGMTDAVRDDKPGRAQAYSQALDRLATGEAKVTVQMEKFAHAAEANLFLGQYGAALENAREAHRLLEQLPLAKRTAEALNVLYLRGTIHLELGQPAAAATVFEEGAALVPAILAEAHGEPKDAVVANFAAASFFAKMAVAELLTNNAAGARSAIERGWSAARDSGMDGLGEFLGLARLQAQEAIDATPPSARSMRRAREIMATDPVGSALLGLSETLNGAPNPAAVAALVATTAELLGSASREDSIELHDKLGRALERVGDEDGAIRQFVAAIALVEKARFQSRDSEAIPAFFSRFIDIYGAAIAALQHTAQRGDRPVDPALGGFGKTYAEIALHFSEAARARQFSELYGPALMASFGTLGGLPDDMAARERKLRSDVARASRIGLLSAIETPLQARQQSDVAAKAYLGFVEEVRKRYPSYAALAFPEPVAPRELPRALDDKFILSYAVTDDAVYWWLILDRKIVDFGRSDIPKSRLREDVKRFIGRIDSDVPALCEALVRAPFGRIAKMAPGGAPPRVIVIPDDVLYALPWEALCGLHGGSLGESFVISYAPSLTVLAQAVDAKRAPARKTAFLVGNTQDQATTIPGLGSSAILDPAPFAKVVSVLKGIGYAPAVLEGRRATREALLALDLTPYALLHFDTHAFAGKPEPLLPSLLLHPSAEAPYGLFSLTDVAKLKLKARLVALSACETALGRASDPVPGEGVEALARLFMLAGAKSVIATLWDVQSDAAGALMEDFYKEIGSGGAPDMATALFRAKAATRARFKRREHWTGFILIGDPGP